MLRASGPRKPWPAPAHTPIKELVLRGFENGEKRSFRHKTQVDTNKIYSLLTGISQDESWNSALAEASRPVIRRRDVSDGRGSRCQMIALCASQVSMLQVLEWCYMTGNHPGYCRRSHILHVNTLPSVSAITIRLSDLQKVDAISIHEATIRLI